MALRVAQTVGGISPQNVGRTVTPGAKSCPSVKFIERNVTASRAVHWQERKVVPDDAHETHTHTDRQTDRTGNNN